MMRVETGRMKAAREADVPPGPTVTSAPIFPPNRDGAQGASLVQVALDRLRAQAASVRRRPLWRHAANWSARPFVTTRGHLILAAVVVVVMLGQAGLRDRGSVSRPVPVPVPSAVVATPMTRPPPVVAPPTSAPEMTPAPQTIGDPPQVVGIVGRLPGNAVVLVRGEDGTQAVAVGGRSGEWTLVELSPTEAVFERNGARRTVELAAVE